MRRFFRQYWRGVSRSIASLCLQRFVPGHRPGPASIPRAVPNGRSTPASWRQPGLALELGRHLGLEPLQVADDLACLLGLAAGRHAPGPAGTSRTGSSVAVRCCASAPSTASSSRPWRISDRPRPYQARSSLGSSAGRGGRRPRPRPGGRSIASRRKPRLNQSAALRSGCCSTAFASARPARSRRPPRAGGRGWRARRRRPATAAAWRRTRRRRTDGDRSTSSAIALSLSRRYGNSYRFIGIGRARREGRCRPSPPSPPSRPWQAARARRAGCGGRARHAAPSSARP